MAHNKLDGLIMGTISYKLMRICTYMADVCHVCCMFHILLHWL